MRRIAAAALLSLTVALPAQANYQVRGTFQYKDREFNLSGFTGSEPNRPIRFADVEVVDANTQQLLASGATDGTGTFTLQVVDNVTRNLTVRVRTSSAHTSDLFITVRQTGTSAIFAVATTYNNHGSTQNIDFTANPIAADQGAGGDPFNVYDCALDGMDFVAALNGGRPNASQSLTLYWNQGSGIGTFYDAGNRAIYLYGKSTDSDGYDDSVILHEFGHYVEFVLAASDNPADSHGPNDCLVLQLSWSEGYATFLQNLVRDWKGYSRPDLYVDTSGQPGPGGVLLSYTVETPAYGIPGPGNEITVNATLWDTYDVTTTADATPSTDDDPMRVAGVRESFWDVLINYLPQPTVSTISIEDYWDGWFLRGHDSETEMRQVFAARGMEFYDDTFEQDDSLVQARNGGIQSGTTHHTIYPAGDSDWTRFDAVLGGMYVFETRNLPCGTDTEMRLWASNGTTLLAQNDDQSPTDLSSRIAWTASLSGPVYLQVRRRPPPPTDPDTYGSYDLRVNITVAVEVSDIQISASPAGVRLAWRAAADATFSHFDVERADQRNGPWARRNDAPLVSGAGEPQLFEFVDAQVEPEQHYFYRLVGVESDGQRTFYGPWEIVAAAPLRLVLYPPQPNPFNPRTQLRFDLATSGPVTLRIHDLRGRVVRTLVRGETLPAGTRVLHWDGRDDAGRDAASGIYWVRLDCAQGRETQRAVLLR